MKTSNKNPNNPNQTNNHHLEKKKASSEPSETEKLRFQNMSNPWSALEPQKSDFFVWMLHGLTGRN